MRRPLHVTTKAAVIPSGGSKAASTACFTLAASSSAGSGSLGNTSPMGHGCVDGSGSCLLTVMGVKLTAFFPIGKRHTPLVAEVPGGAHDPAGHCDVHFLPFAIDDRFCHLRALRVGAREVPDVLGGEVRIEAGDEHGRAHDLGKSGRVMIERVARWRNVRRLELERLRPRDKLVAGRYRRLGGGLGADARRTRLRLAFHSGRQKECKRQGRPNRADSHFSPPTRDGPA